MVKGSRNRSDPEIPKHAQSTTMEKFPTYYFLKHRYRLTGNGSSQQSLNMKRESEEWKIKKVQGGSQLLRN